MQLSDMPRLARYLERRPLEESKLFFELKDAFGRADPKKVVHVLGGITKGFEHPVSEVPRLVLAITDAQLANYLLRAEKIITATLRALGALDLVKGAKLPEAFAETLCVGNGKL
jgi:hypothetical protein